MRTTRFRLGLVAAAASVVLLAGACGSDGDGDSSATTTTEASTSTTVSNAEVVKFDKRIQQELADVGCYSGAIDGIMGPATDAAVSAFQAASGLEVDGEVGPETEKALGEAVAKGETVCTSSPSSTTSTTTPATAPCTATAIGAALPSGAEIQNYACSEGYAGVAYTESGSATTALLEADGASWKDLGNSMCGGASAGYPPSVLEIVCSS